MPSSGEVIGARVNANARRDAYQQQTCHMNIATSQFFQHWQAAHKSRQYELADHGNPGAVIIKDA
jgi:hypothetical protein